jgi:hypothetical protein
LYFKLKIHTAFNSAGVLLATSTVAMPTIKKTVLAARAEEEQPNATRLCKEILRKIRAALTLCALTMKADIREGHGTGAGT